MGRRKDNDHSFEHPEIDAASLACLEAAIQGAGSYVHPTDDLRPRVLESARERLTVSRGHRGILAVAATILLVLVSTVADSVTSSPTSARTRGIDFANLQTRSVGGVDPFWGTYEAFTEIRRDQARKLGSNRESDHQRDD